MISPSPGSAMLPFWGILLNTNLRLKWNYTHPSIMKYKLSGTEWKLNRQLELKIVQQLLQVLAVLASTMDTHTHTFLLLLWFYFLFLPSYWSKQRMFHIIGTHERGDEVHPLTAWNIC